MDMTMLARIFGTPLEFFGECRVLGAALRSNPWNQSLCTRIPWAPSHLIRSQHRRSPARRAKHLRRTGR